MDWKCVRVSEEEEAEIPVNEATKRLEPNAYKMGTIAECMAFGKPFTLTSGFAFYEFTPEENDA